MRIMSTIIYLAVGAAVYLTAVSSVADVSDPWLYIVTVAWPVIILAVGLKWVLIAVVVIAVAVGCWALVEYLRK